MSYNILQIIPELDIGGAERTTIEVAEAIINNGGNAFVLTNGGVLENELANIGAQIIHADVKTKNPIKILFKNVDLIKKIIHDKKIDVVHVRSRAPAVSAYVATNHTGIAFITTYHGIYKAKNKFKRWYNSFMARGDIVIANSEYTKANILSEHGIDADKIRVIYRGVDLDKFDPAKITPKAKKQLADQWNITGDLPKIILPARLTDWKGQKILIKAADILKQQNILADYVFVGSAQGRDEYVSSLKSMIASYGLEKYFHFVGQCNDMPTAYAIADIVVTPSIEPEAFGRTNAEAQAMAKPVISSRLGGAMETIIDNETGFLINANDAPELAKKIALIINMPKDEIAKITDTARIRVQNMFATKSLQENTLRVYDEVLKV